MDHDAAVRRLPDGGGAVDRSSARAGFGGANYHKRAGADAGGSTRAGDTEGVNAGTGRRGCGCEIGISVRRVHRIFGGDGGQYATSR